MRDLGRFLADCADIWPILAALALGMAAGVTLTLLSL